MKLKAIDILYSLISSGNIDIFKNKNTYEKLTLIAEAIDELENLTNCDDCVHIQEKEKNLTYNCLIDVCRSCKRNNNDNFKANP